MKIKINGEFAEVSEGLSVFEYLEQNGFCLDRVAVEKDGEILSKTLWKATNLSDGKSYEIVEFVGGG
ncbi:sulfur carrier protein ThiS [Campylobacter geochelonis]|uniref:Thiamine biosynthesis protein ThiS n=1 Tax=Campylobacter geochelonis TaxID=1780362 RepID=A0A128EJZ1_9BACT|nr:sulfur carrier protein ThiS [Campylobacter geochelonis]QKF71742.1 thiamine biosynthesis protein [Campylobacter geochelonis]CZE47612.1 thiamine biosynthesis protein ThiS [Campylobacter geochelonis]CZE48533.1 thiamine biosynthesis protein ThiS [Campylobacter geochelonis]CZE51161.1 thiamine biosynthesis protein ThiS [Campylobacter geochelonis]